MHVCIFALFLILVRVLGVDFERKRMCVNCGYTFGCEYGCVVVIVVGRLSLAIEVSDSGAAFYVSSWTVRVRVLCGGKW